MEPVKLPRTVTVLGLVLALCAVVMDTQVNTALASVFGAAAAEKVAAIGAVLAALGRAVLGGPPAENKQP